VFSPAIPTGAFEEIDLGPGEWRPMNWDPNRRAIEQIELSDELDDSGQPRPVAVLSGPKF
jgi:hypothetical protein